MKAHHILLAALLAAPLLPSLANAAPAQRDDTRAETRSVFKMLRQQFNLFFVEREATATMPQRPAVRTTGNGAKLTGLALNGLLPAALDANRVDMTVIATRALAD